MGGSSILRISEFLDFFALIVKDVTFINSNLTKTLYLSFTFSQWTLKSLSLTSMMITVISILIKSSQLSASMKHAKAISISNAKNAIIRKINLQKKKKMKVQTRNLFIISMSILIVISLTTILPIACIHLFWRTLLYR